MIKIFNTLTKKKENFIPLNPPQVTMYICGPTVYNYIHIGNARSAVVFDTIRRYLQYRGYQVKYVSNFTDVDDKIIKAAREKEVTPKQLVTKYIAAYQTDMKALNVLPATMNPRATDN
ncbi:MAG: class I tRNA ligase family protein, partial [Bombilactobacillus sp.]